MIVKRIIDSEYENSDPMRTLFAISDGLPFDIGPLSFSSFDLIYSVTNVSTTHSGLDITKTQTISMHFPEIFREALTNQIVERLEGASFLTHKTSITVPVNDDNPENFNFNPYSSDAFSYYNLVNIGYEQFTIVNDERKLPNFCLGALWRKGDWQDTNSRIGQEQIKYYTMFNQIQELDKSQILAPGADVNNFEFDDEYLLAGYHSDPDIEIKADYYKNMLASDTSNVDEYRDANTNVFIDFQYTTADSDLIGNTPFFNRIKLPFVSGPREFANTVGEAFIESGLTDKLVKSFRNTTAATRAFKIRSQNSIEEANLKVYSISDLYENIGFNEELNAFNEMYLRSDAQRYSQDSDSPFVFYLNKLILMGKLRAAGNSFLKDFSRLIENPEDHDGHIIGYRVEKRREGRQAPIQTFHFFWRNDLADFVDTQVRFDTVYNYSVSAMFVVGGSSYSYSNVNATSFGIEFDFSVTPSIQVVEIPLSIHSLRIVEPPPINPEVSFYNEKTKKNKVKVRLEHQDGNLVDEYSKKPLRPFGNNQEYIQKLEEYFRTENVVVTSGKTSAGTYEVYRIDFPPTSYSDFEDSLLLTVESDVFYMNGLQSKNVMFDDYIKHQKKYYYCFRTLTHNGNPSELSRVYVVEMYEDADETFLSFDLYEPPEPKYFQKAIHMRKYLQIIPNPEHVAPNEEELINEYDTAYDALSNGALVLGNTDQEYLWQYKNKRNYIKLRLESKNSGRKMDINLYFKIKSTFG